MQVVHQQPKHNNPKDYGLENQEAWKMAIRKLHKDLKIAHEEVERYKTAIMNTPIKFRDLLYAWHAEATDSERKILGKIDYYKNIINGIIDDKQIDIERVKQVPIDTIVKVAPNGFFALREERTPSCYYYRNTNRYWDFGDNTGGDVINLYMAIHSCTFREACKELST